MMNNLTKFIAMVALLAGIMASYAQHKPDKDKIKVLKVAFLTEKLNLNSSEAQEFWPIYNDHELKMDELHKKEWEQVRHKAKELEKVSEKEAGRLVQLFSQLEDEKNTENKHFLEKVHPILSSKKTLLLIKAEEDFKKQLFKQYWAKHRKD
jgi:Skp family chaperone for outer membrane proteins